MKTRYNKNNKTMTITMDNKVDTITLTGGIGFFDKIDIVGTQDLPRCREFITGISVLYYQKRAELENKEGDISS